MFNVEFICCVFCESESEIVLAQVRRMVGALVAVGRGKLSVRQVQDLLDSRDSIAYPQNMAAPPFGLFLINVEYNDSGRALLPSFFSFITVQILSAAFAVSIQI